MSGMKYRTIVADPPWPHDDGTGVDLRNGGKVTHLPYASMALEDITALPVYELSDNIDHDAHLYLWTTSRHLPDAFVIAKAWGFSYTATLIWCKAARGWSTGGQFQNNVEFVLFCTRQKRVSRPEVLRLTSALADAADRLGISRSDVDEYMGTSDMGGWWLSRIETRCACPTNVQWKRLKTLLQLGDELDGLVGSINFGKGLTRTSTRQVSNTRWFEWPRGGHSAKPEAFLDLVESVSSGPYLELFARRQRLGWDTWGDEALNHVDLGAVS